MTHPLTILLPLKGRHLHTLRFLFHADRAGLPYHFLIADGEVHPAIARVLENPLSAFPNLDIEYIRYPNDARYSDFYRKMADASARVRTPYVLQADNDDFLVASGIERCLKFLDARPDYVGCGGGVGGFELNAAREKKLEFVVGTLQRMTSRFMEPYGPRDDAAASAARRIVDGFRTFHTTYYYVFRADALATIHRELAEFDLTDLILHEVYFGARALSLGKARRLDAVMSYMRQAGTATTIGLRTDWAEHLVHSQFTTELAAIISRLSALVAASDTVDSAQFANELRPLFARKLREYLEGHYRTPKPVALPFSYKANGFIRALLPKRLVSTIQRNRSREYVFSALRSGGAGADDVATFRREWTEIEAVCEGTEFLTFVRSSAPELLSVFRDSRLATA